jgi:hypothetical protein
MCHSLLGSVDEGNEQLLCVGETALVHQGPNGFEHLIQFT